VTVSGYAPARDEDNYSRVVITASGAVTRGQSGVVTGPAVLDRVPVVRSP
jgi:hypothetical protein